MKTLGPTRISFLLAVLAPAASADRLHLANGEVIDVDRWREVGDQVVYERFGGEITIAKTEVLRIERTAEPADTRSQAPVFVPKPVLHGIMEVPVRPGPPGSPAPAGRPVVARAVPFSVQAIARCPWRTAPQCLQIFPEGTFRASAVSDGDIRGWQWRLFLANPGPATVVDVRLEFQNPALSFDYVKRCGVVLSAFETTTIYGDHTIRASAGDVWTIRIEVAERTHWC